MSGEDDHLEADYEDRFQVDDDEPDYDWVIDILNRAVTKNGTTEETEEVEDE